MTFPTAAPAGADIDHVRSLYLQTPATLAGNLVGMLLVAGIFGPLAGGAQRMAWLAWLGVGLGLWLLRLAHYLRFLRHPEASPELLRRWRPTWVALVLLQAALWGIAVWLFGRLGNVYHLMSLIFIVYSYCLSSVQLLATQRSVFLVFLSLVLLPTILRVATDDSQPWHLQLALVLTLMFGITLLMGRTYGTALGHALTLKSRTEELAARLQAEMKITEDARRAAEHARLAAEAANQAKTQFFAAASHDLRQPLHAMGLFAEALRQRSHDPEVASLVDSINESVDALEGLFGELLDITRIDTGGIDVHPAPVRMRDVYTRLRLHFEPVAFEKGLMLSFRGERHVVQADPVLLERVLRNLVSNAIRCTDDGGVLVACRPRRGRLLVQVWDSGIGIAEASLPRIWDEFFQVQGARPPQAHQRKGLGLGLAIVKRLAGLMSTAVRIRSRVRRGTVFEFELPAGRAVRHARDTGPETVRLPIGLTLQGRLIAVVEDDTVVRQGLVVLLQAWGARVLSFDTVDAVVAWLGGPTAAPPDLLLVDYRLPDKRTGVDALAAVRRRWPDRRLPAIVVTGSSMAGEADGADLHDYHLLTKPVLPNKLRAMIAFKLGVRQDRAA